MKTSDSASRCGWNECKLKSRLLWLVLSMLLAIPCAAQTCNYTVTSLADSGAGTLRAGLADSTVTNICFNVAGTIKLASQLQINYPVTITGNVTIDGINQVQIFQVNLSSGSDAVRINGLVLTNGNGMFASAYGTDGGALEVLSGNVTLVSTSITNSTAPSGGGVYNHGTLTLSGCNISSNTAVNGTGGGIYNDANSVLNLQGTTVSQNSSVDGAGGLYNGSTANVTGGVFSSNTGYFGGAIYNDNYGNLQISGGTSFQNNTANAGGAIVNYGTTQITQTVFTGNAAQGGGEVSAQGGAMYNVSTVTLTESTLNANTSSQYGGAIENTGDGVLTLVNDTFYGNSAATGTAIDNPGTATIHNTIMFGTAPSCNGCGDLTSDNLVDVQPYLGPLALNGGSTVTMMPLPGGPAVGGGNPNAVVDDTDQRGFSRTSSSGSVDVGAVQSHYSAVTYTTQPSNTFINQTITPPVAVQVLEVDGETKNYPLGVPVVVSLFTSDGVQASSSLSGTLTQLPAATNGATAASFADLAVSTAGSYELQATIVPAAIASSASEDPAYGVISNIFQINSAPVITWQPAPIPYGPMPAAELNATATVNGSPATGTFVYTFAGTSTQITAGQIYPAGSYKVQVTFTPAGTTIPYSLITALQISPAVPVLTWPTPAAIYTSTPLGSTQLDATATGVTGAALPGAFVYNPAAGTTLTAGSQVLSTTFTPTDNANYTTATAQVNIQVNAVTAAKVAIQESANPITFGQNETFTAVVTGTDGNPISGGTASFTVDGTVIGSAPVVSGSAAVSTATVGGGTHQVGVTYTNTTTNQTLTASASLTVNKATPVLAWPTPAPIYTSTALSATQLDATATGVNGTALAGTFAYNPAAGTMLTAGSHVLSTTFTPTDTTDYNTNTAQVIIQVNAPTAASVALQESANPITFGQSETFTAVATGSDGKPFSGGTATFSVDGVGIGSVAVVNGLAAVTDASLTAGTHKVSVSYTNSGTTQPLTASASLTVNKATPVLTWPTPAPIYTSTPLSATQLDATATGVNGTALPGTFAYNPAAGTMLTAGSHVLSTTFTPTDTTDYNTNTAQVTIQVNAPTAATVVIQESANPITFGQSETFTAVATGSDGKPFSGGTATFSVDGVGVGSAAVVNGSAAVTDASLTAGTHKVSVSYTNSGTTQPLTASASLTVNKATPVLTWPTPAPIYTSTPLSATQLNATATGVNGTALAGTFAYNPAAGTMLTAGSHVLSTTFTPTDTTDYNTNTAQVTIQVNAPTAATVVIQESANPITFGQSETFTAVATGSDGKPFSGGTATFSVDGVGIGSAAVVNGSAAVTDASLTAGTHKVSVSYTNSSTTQPLTASASLTVNKATPVLAWPTPAPIYTSTALSATQLDATATGVNGAALPGTFAYNPAAGTMLTAGSHLLSTTFTPTDTTDYNTNTAQVTIQVNPPAAAGVTIQESANPITFGKIETFTAVIAGSDGQPYSGGTATFTSDGTAIGAATVVNGSASVATSSLTAGTHQIGVSYSNSSLSQPLTGSTSLVVDKATPVLAWPTPASIFTVTPLSSTQLDATATGVNGAALPGTFVYSPAAGTVLPAGSQTLSTTFTPTDITDYTTATAQVSIQVGYSTISITSVSPGTAQLGTTPLTIMLTGTGFTSTSVVEVNDAAIASKMHSSTSLTATLPATDLANAGTLKLLVYDPQSKFSSNIVQFIVTAPAADVTLSIPPNTGSGEQPTVTIGLNSAYPTDLKGTLTLTFAPSGNNGVDDPAIQLSTGGRTLNFTVPAGSTTTPKVALQTGTVAGTITLTLTLTAGGVDVTPAGLTPITLVIAAAAPVITSVTFTNNSDGQITVVISGFSNTRDMSQAEFVFTGSDASHLSASKVDVAVTGLFSPWYSSTTSDQYGSEFTYTQNFQLSRPDAGVTGVSVTLANSAGTSGSVNSQ